MQSEHVALALREVAELLRCFGQVIDIYRHLPHVAIQSPGRPS